MSGKKKKVALPNGLLGVAIALLCAVLLAACPVGPFGPPPNPESVRQVLATTGVAERIINSSPLSPLLAATGPRFAQITASNKVFTKSDYLVTSITVTATITAPAGIAQVVLWHRVGDAQPLTAVAVASVGVDQYAVTVKGTEVPGSDYGVWAFYFTADDKMGQHGQSPLDTSVQFLPCVG